MREYTKMIITGAFLFASLFVFTTSVSAATQYQKCTKGTSCVVGEFLYDDEYVPIATASCTITSRDASGAAVLNSEAMTPSADGWYQYTVTTTDKAEGLYRTQICCTVNPDYLCLDRSFTIESVTPTSTLLSKSDIEGAVWDANTASHSGTGTFGKNLQNPTLTASDIWSYANRTLTSYGNLIADIWNFSSRSISGFGTLASDVWSSAVRTLTGTSISNGDELATKKNVEAVNVTTIQTINNVNTNNNKNVTDSIIFGSMSGTLVFKPTVTNSSTTVPQSVPFTYYLPSELTKSNIISIDPTLKINESVSNPALAISGEIKLGPSASQTFSIIVKDVWVIPGSEIASLRNQTDALFKPLAKTSYFGQGSTIKSDIFASLDRILSGNSNANTPQDHIKAYREGMISLRAAKDKLNDLKSLVASAGSIGTIFGFVGGIQVFAVWGLVIVFIAGFVFLALYMKNLKKEETAEIEKDSNKSRLITGVFSENRGITFHNPQIKFLVIGLIIGGGILFGFFLIPKSNNTAKNNDETIPLVVKKVEPSAITLPTLTPSPAEKKIKITEEVINAREGAGIQYKKVGLVLKGKDYREFARDKDTLGDEWIQVQVNKDIKGWILAKYTEDVGIPAAKALFSSTPLSTPSATVPRVLGATNKKVLITVPEGERVNVRSSASLESKIVMTLAQEITTEQLDELPGWIKIEFGWIPAIYVKDIQK